MDKNDNTHTFILAETENVPCCSCFPSWKSWEVSETGNKNDYEKIKFSIENKKREFSLTKGEWKNNFYVDVDDGYEVAGTYDTTNNISINNVIAIGAEVGFHLQLQQNKNLTKKSFYEQINHFEDHNCSVYLNCCPREYEDKTEDIKDDDEKKITLYTINNEGTEKKKLNH